MSRSRVTAASALALLFAAGGGGLAGYTLLILRPLRLDRHPPSPEFSLARALGQDGAGLALFTLSMLLLFALYLVGVVAARGAGRHGAAVGLAFGTFFALVLLPAHPAYSRDIFHYIATARVFFRYGENPLLVSPQAFPSDPLTALADWRWLPSPYGPLWTLLKAAPYYATGGSESAVTNLVAFKGLAVAGALIAAWLAGAIAEHLRPGSRAMAIVLIAWNPLLVLHTAADGHNDAVMLAALLLAVFLAVRGRIGWAGWALAAASLIKPAALMVLPVFVAWLLYSRRPRRWREAALVVVAVPVAALALYLPFWQGPNTLRSSFEEGTYLTTSIPAVLLAPLSSVLPADVARKLLTVGVRLAFLPLLALFARRARGGIENLVAVAAVAYAVLLAVATPWFMPWYALWPLVLAAAVPWRARIVAPVLALTFGALLLPVATAFLAVMLRDDVSWRPMHLVAVSITFAPCAMVTAWPRLAGRRARAARGAGASVDNVTAARVP